MGGAEMRGSGGFSECGMAFWGTGYLDVYV